VHYENIGLINCGSKKTIGLPFLFLQ